MDDIISRQAAIDALYDWELSYTWDEHCKEEYDSPYIISPSKVIDGLPSAQQEQRWIPCSERLPENNDPVNVTWVNHNPEPYYANIKDKPFTATGHYCKGKWYWYSSTCQDYLNEYGRCDVDEIDKDIEVIAWMPLPEPYVPDIHVVKMAESEDEE